MASTSKKMNEFLSHKSQEQKWLTNSIKRTADSIKTLNEILICTRQRAMTNEDLDVCCWKIWDLAREERHAMDSGRLCTEIKKLMRMAVADVERRVEQANVETSRAIGHAADLQEELKLLKDENANLQRQISVSTRELNRVLKIVDDLKNPGRSPFAIQKLNQA